MDEPHLLLLDKLIKPIKAMQDAINESEKNLVEGIPEIIEKGVFSYTVSLFEVMQTEILAYYLEIFPEKIDAEKLQIKKENILKSSTDIRRRIIQDFLIGLSYYNIKNYLKIFYKILSIEDDDKDIIDNLVEIKETRNLLLHNNLKINELYLNKAGKCCRANDDDALHEKCLKLDYNYIFYSLNILKNISKNIESKLLVKYHKYTKPYLLKLVWNYLFRSPVLVFDEYFEYDDHKLWLKKDRKYIKQMVENYSNSERTFLYILFNHFLVDIIYVVFRPEVFNFYSLDFNSRRKYLFLTNALIHYTDIFRF
jgi:hypothetical protein